MDPHSLTGAGGGCKRAGATGTRRLWEAPGGPSFGKAKNKEFKDRTEEGGPGDVPGPPSGPC